MATDTATLAPPEEPTPVAAPATAVQEAVKERPPAGQAKDKGAKGKQGAKEKQGKKGKQGEQESAEAPDGPSIAAHPRATRAVARAKGWGGLLGFAIAGYLSLSTSTLAEAALRALIAGVVCYVATWAGAVFLWRRLVMLELKGREQQLHAAAEERAKRQLPPGPAQRPGPKAGAGIS